jgi:sugar lactone lactonase YvrE
VCDFRAILCPVKKTVRNLIALAGAGLFLFSLYLYRTVQLGRGDAFTTALENMNPPGKMGGPEGLQFDATGDLFVGDSYGRIWALGQGGTPEIYAELKKVSAAAEAAGTAIQAGGMAFDPEGNLYVAAHGFDGGSILKVHAGGKEIHTFARGIGVVNYALITSDAAHLWVSDYRASGRLLRFSLAAPQPAQPDLVIEGLEYPNGLALGQDEKTLYAAETYTGCVTAIDLTSSPALPRRMLNLKGAFATGSLSGLAFDPRDTERRFLFVAENLRGTVTLVDVRSDPARVVRRFRFDLMGGRPCPASLAIRNGYVYFTDLWACNPIRILLGIPELRAHAYRFPVVDPSILF